MSVRVENRGGNGLVTMLAGLLEANLERDPGRRRLLGDAVYELVAPDAGVSATIAVANGGIGIAAGPSRGRRDRARGGPDVILRASSADLLELAASPLRLGLPDALSPAGRTVLGRIARGRIRISGLLRHPVLVSRLARLLSVA